MKSPDSRVQAHLNISASGELSYRVIFKGAIVVEESTLGVGVEIGNPISSHTDESYVTRGNHTSAHNHFNTFKFPIRHVATSRNYQVDFRIYDDGVAYRYIVPGQQVQHVDGEASSWHLASGAKVWYFERLTPGWKLKSYAGEWMSTRIEDLHTATPAHVGPVQGTPLVLELPQGLGYAAVTKAALTSPRVKTGSMSKARLSPLGARLCSRTISTGW